MYVIIKGRKCNFQKKKKNSEKQIELTYIRVWADVDQSGSLVSWQFNIFIIFFLNFLKDYKFHNLKSAPFCSIGIWKGNLHEYDNHVCLDWSVLITNPTGTDQALCSPRFAQSPFYLFTFLNFKIKMKKKKLFL